MGLGWVGMDGIGSPGGRGYRASYGANNSFFNTSAQSYPPISNGGDLRPTVQLKATASDK